MPIDEELSLRKHSFVCCLVLQVLQELQSQKQVLEDSFRKVPLLGASDSPIEHCELLIGIHVRVKGHHLPRLYKSGRRFALLKQFHHLFTGHVNTKVFLELPDNLWVLVVHWLCAVMLSAVKQCHRSRSRRACRHLSNRLLLRRILSWCLVRLILVCQCLPV